MSQNFSEIYSQLKRISALTSSVMGEQAAHLNAGIQRLSLELRDDTTLEQEKNFKDNIKRSHFLMREIIYHWEVYNTTLELLYQPSQVSWEEVDVYSAIEHAIRDSKWFVGDPTSVVNVDTTIRGVVIYSVYSLFKQAISNLIICSHLLAPSNHITITTAYSETELTLKISGHKLSLSQVDFIDKQVCDLSMELASLITLILDGSFNWKADEAIPDELVVLLPRKSA